MARRTTVVMLALAAVLTACTVGEPGPAGSDAPAATDQRQVGPALEVVGNQLQLVEVDGEVRTLAALDPDVDGELVHATLRPGARGRQTVLALTRAPAADGGRYELRYLVADERTATDLYWFPWRLQVADELTSVLDTAPVPVWSPDGAAIAWVEWDGEGTRLRTVGWRDDGTASNPSDEAAAYQLDGVPPGTQLDRWEVGSDGVPTLRGVAGDTVWRIRLDVGHRAIAMPEPR